MKKVKVIARRPPEQDSFDYGALETVIDRALVKRGDVSSVDLQVNDSDIVISVGMKTNAVELIRLMALQKVVVQNLDMRYPDIFEFRTTNVQADNNRIHVELFFDLEA